MDTTARSSHRYDPRDLPPNYVETTSMGTVCAHQGTVLLGHPLIFPEYMEFTPAGARKLSSMLEVCAGLAEQEIDGEAGEERAEARPLIIRGD